MSSEKMKADMQHWFDTFNMGDIEALNRLIPDLYAENYVLHDPAFPEHTFDGHEGLRKFVVGALQMMQGKKIRIENFVAEGNLLATRFSMIHTDPAQQGKVSLDALAISRFENGKVAEEWELSHSYDSLAAE